MTVKLQGIYNKQEAKAVKELKTGDVIMWNYGYTSTVVDLIPSKTGKTITCLLKSNQDGVVRERKMGAERLVNTPFGQEITERLLKMKLEENPDMTAEEWQDTKSQFLTFLFAMFVKETPQAMAELAQHTWDELQAKEV